MPVWLIVLLCAAALPLLGLLVLGVLFVHIRWKYLDVIIRVFEEKPLFIIPRGKPAPGAEDVRFLSHDGLTLRGCYLRTPRQRRGVILFGLEFGSNRWSCRDYCERLLQAGYDVFAFEPRSQGDSDKQPGYDPLQWVTTYEVADTRAAIKYLLKRPDADPKGVGLFGISKGGSAGLAAAASEPAVRCVVTDGAFATRSTVVPYIQRWVIIYSDLHHIQRLLPTWYYGCIAMAGVNASARRRGVKFVGVEAAVSRLKRPLLMIHGEADGYIKPEMARDLFDRAGSKVKDLWVVPKAKHNQALHTAGDEYHARLVAFFDAHLGGPVSAADRPTRGPEPETNIDSAAAMTREAPALPARVERR